MTRGEQRGQPVFTHTVATHAAESARTHAYTYSAVRRQEKLRNEPETLILIWIYIFIISYLTREKQFYSDLGGVFST